MTQYTLSQNEQRQYDEILEQISQYGGLYSCDQYGQIITDSSGQAEALDYIILGSKRFLVDSEGVLWRHFAEGTSKNPSVPHGGGAPWRNNRVEMWNGKLRQSRNEDGDIEDEKILVAAVLDKRVNGHPGMSQLQWYKTVKGYRHPHEEVFAQEGSGDER